MPSPIHRTIGTHSWKKRKKKKNRIDFGGGGYRSSKCRSSASRLQGDNTPPFPLLEEEHEAGLEWKGEMGRMNGAERSKTLRERAQVWADRVVTLARLSAVRDPISLIIIIQLYVGTAYREYSLVPCYYPVLSAASPARNRGQEHVSLPSLPIGICYYL